MSGINGGKFILPVDPWGLKKRILIRVRFYPSKVSFFVSGG
jgi:hypothetical protein